MTQSCYKCGSPRTKLCDGKVIPENSNCDRPMCNHCAHLVGEGIACIRGKDFRQRSQHFTVDYCDECFENGTRKSEK